MVLLRLPQLLLNLLILISSFSEEMPHLEVICQKNAETLTWYNTHMFKENAKIFFLLHEALCSGIVWILNLCINP